MAGGAGVTRGPLVILVLSMALRRSIRGHGRFSAFSWRPEKGGSAGIRMNPARRPPSPELVHVDEGVRVLDAIEVPKNRDPPVVSPFR